MLCFVGLEPPVSEIFVPGDTRTCKKISDPSRKSTHAIVQFFIELHALGWSLGGNFKSSDFGITHYGFLRGEKSLLPKLKKIKSKARYKDLCSLADVIENGIYAKAKAIGLPADLEDFLWLLRNFKQNLYYPLLEMHVSHYNELRKSDLFGNMYNTLETIRILDNKKYGNIVGKILCGRQNWISKAKRNAHLHAVLRYRPCNGRSVKVKIKSFMTGKVTYKNTTASLLTFRRNGHAHLVKDNSIGPGGMEAAIRAAIAVLALHQHSSFNDKGLPSEKASDIAAVIEKVLMQN